MPNSACNNTNGLYFTDGRSHGFSPTAWDRLNAALASVPGSSPEEALRKASANSQDCAMVWTNNLPSLLFPGSRPAGARESVHLNVLANTLADCADAITRLN